MSRWARRFRAIQPGWQRHLAPLLVFTLVLLVAGSWFIRKFFGPVSLDQLLFHLEHAGLGESDPKLLWRATRYLAGAVLISLLLQLSMTRLRPGATRGVWLLLVFGAVASVRATVTDACQPGQGDYLAAHYVDPLQVTVRVPSPAPDVLLVYVESFDDAYARPQAGLPAEAPRLQTWRDAHESFGQLMNLSGASWTMAGIFSSLCGLPLRPVGLLGHNGFEHARHFFAGGECLTDLLAERGWEISFYGGASLAFAGKGKFLAEHGVARAFGRDEWRARGVEVPADGWGLLDSELVDRAWDDMSRPRDNDRPRLHMLLTVDTHGPTGAIDEGCSNADDADDATPDGWETMNRALHCTDESVDRLVHRFIEQSDGRPKVVWIMGDHLSPLPRPNPSGTGSPEAPSRGVFHALARFDAEGRVLPGASAWRQFTHVDVMPTLAEAIGLQWTPSAHHLGLGTSLLDPALSATLAERDGFERLDARLACESPLFERLWLTSRDAWRQANAGVQAARGQLP